MAAFSPSGVEFVAKNLSGYLSDLAKVDKAQQALGKSTQSVGSQFASAHTGASSFASRIGSMIPGVGSLASALGGVATVAGGIVAAQVFNKIAEGVGAFVSTGLDAVDTAQRLEVGLGALLTMNNLYERTTETMMVATMTSQEWGEAQAEAAKKSDDLAFRQRELTAEINTQNASIQEQRQRIIQMADGLDRNQQIARLAEMELALEGMNRELAETTTQQGKLNNITQEYTSVTQTSFKQVMGFAEAQEMAAKQSKDLLAFVEKLAIVSPFEQDQVAIVAKLATAAGLGVEQTKSFTAGFLDLAAAVGIGSESLDFAADQLLQVAKIGKITTVDLRQLRRLGIDLEKIIGTQMGMSIEEFNQKAAQSPEIFNKLFEAVTEFSKNTFAGTAEKMATSLSGLRSTFTDIFRVGSKNLLRPLIEAVGPSVSEMLGRLSDMVTGPDMAKIGEAIPRVLFGAFESLTGGEEGGLFSGLKGLGLDSSTAKSVTEVTAGIAELVQQTRDLVTVFQTSGFTGLGQALGIPPETITGIQDFITEAQRLKDVFAGGFESGGLGGGISALFGDIRPQLESLAGQLLAAIPGFLSTLREGIATHLRENVPDFQSAMSEWSGKFWGWANTAATGAAVALGALLLAISSWVMSPEGQTQMVEIGRSVGANIIAGLKLIGENSNDYTEVMLRVGGALLLAIPAVAGNLIVIGGQIVAGIASGILESIGVEITPATFSELGPVLSGIIENEGKILGHVGTLIVNKINDGLIAALRTGIELGKEIKKKIDEAKKAVDIGEWVTLGGDLMNGLLEGIKENSAQVLEFLKDLAYDSLASLKGIWLSSSPSRAFAEEARNAMDGLVMGAQDNAERVTSTFSGIGQSAIDSLMTGMTIQDTSFIDRFIDDLNIGGFLTEAGAGGGQRRNFRNIVHNAIRGNMSLVESGDPTQIMAIIQREAARFHFPPSFAAEFARAEGLIGHLQGTFSTMFQKMRIENLSSSTSLASQFASIGSAFADIVKEQLDAFEKGKEEAGKLEGAIESLTSKIREQQFELATDKEEVRLLVLKLGDQKQAQDELNASLVEAIANHGEDSEQVSALRERMSDLQIQIDKTKNSIEEKNIAYEKFTSEIDKNQEALERNKQALADYRKELTKAVSTGFNNPWATDAEELSSDLAMMELLQEFLDSGTESLRLFGNETEGIFGGTGLSGLMTRVFAQEELNRLLAEQAEREQEILDLERAQKQLDFLGQQLNLMKMLSDRGLNPADILNGITLGVNASAQDLLSATNRVVQAMVDQINSDLQIASPSRVMARIGHRVVEGMARGIEGGRSILDSAIRSTPLLNGSLMRPMAQPAYAGGNTYNTYNEFPMTVHTNSTPQGVVRQYEVKRSMYAS